MAQKFKLQSLKNLKINEVYTMHELGSYCPSTINSVTGNLQWLLHVSIRRYKLALSFSHMSIVRCG